MSKKILLYEPFVLWYHHFVTSLEIALEHTELSSRELAHKITDEQGVFISESSVYGI